MDFKAPWELWNPLSKAVHGKFLRPGRHSEHNWIQYLANFHRSRAWKIVLIFNSDITSGTPDIHPHTGLCHHDHDGWLVADVLVPNRHQAISNHHDDLTMTLMSHIMRHIYHATAIKQCPRDDQKSGICWFLCYWRVCFLTAITHYVAHAHLVRHWPKHEHETWWFWHGCFGFYIDG